MRYRTLLVGVCAAVVMAGCGGDDDAAPAADDVADTSGQGADSVQLADDGDTAASGDEVAAGDLDACSLLTEEDVEGVLDGLDVALQDSQPTACSWLSEDPFAVISLVAMPNGLAGGDFDTVVAALAGVEDVSGLPADAGERVEGIGDGAFTLEMMGVPMLYFGSGQHLFTVSVASDLDAAATKAAHEELARIALGRMP